MAPHIDVSSLPDVSNEDIYFHDTSFFQHHTSRELPSPESVLQKAESQRMGAVKFENLGVIVKFRSELMFEEAQTMRAIRSAFPQNEIPVPEVFAWRCHENQRFMYMSLVKGETLYNAWPLLTETDKESICLELRNVISSLHSITREPTDALICSINNGKLQDRFFQFDDVGGPFSSIRSFNNFFFAVAIHQTPRTTSYIDGPYRDFLHDDGEVYFTHGDLTPTNIMVVGRPGSYKIEAIIDWEQAGWYPEYWEYCKLLTGVHYDHQWRTAGWVDRLMRPFPNEWTAYAEYSLWRNP